MKSYWVWVDRKLGMERHELHACLEKDNEVLGRYAQTWSTALGHLRRLMKKGYVVTVYEVRQ